MLLERIRQDMKLAMKAKEKTRLATLRSALAAIQKEEVSQSAARELTDPEIEKVLASEAKKRQEAADAFGDADRPEMKEAELVEKAILEEYLPEKLTDEEIEAIVVETLGSNGFTEMKDMGQAMKAVNEVIAGRADGGSVAALVKQKLG